MEKALKSRSLSEFSGFPDPKNVFVGMRSFAEIKGTCLYVLDTNVLLAPYTVGAADLKGIAAVFRSLADAKRLVVPGHVAREFARIRPVKLGELHKQLLDSKSRVPSLRESYPALDGCEAHTDLLRIKEQLGGLMDQYRAVIDRLVDTVRGWNWDDPVTKAYGEILGNDVLFDPPMDSKAVTSEYRRRVDGRIPPGFKDSNKEVNSEGDLIVWLTILELGRARRSDVVFVSGEEKTDWWHRSGGAPLFVRYELVNEYYAATGGRTFHIIDLGELLATSGAEPSLVNDVRRSQERVRPLTKLGRLTDAELVERTLQIVHRLRGMLAVYRRDSRAASDAMFRRRDGEAVAGEVRTSEDVSRYLMDEYDTIKVEASLLRDELRARLPAVPAARRLSDYSRPVNPFGVEEVADDLEGLALSL